MRKVFIASGVFFCISIALILGGFAMADWDISNLNSQAEAQEITLDVSEITQLTADFMTGDVNVSVGDVEQAVVKYKRHFRMKGDEKKYFDDIVSTVEGGVWKLAQKMERNRIWSFWFFPNFKDWGIEIILPRDKTDLDLSLVDDNGSVTLQDMELKSLNIDLDNGRIKMGNVKVQTSAIVKSDNGVATCDNVSADSFSVDLANGAVTLNTVVSATSIVADTNNGKIILINCEANNIASYTRNGRVEFTRAKANSIDFKTNNGTIEGSIVGNQADFAVYLDIGNGSANISEKATGSKTLTLETDNGSANISFVE